MVHVHGGIEHCFELTNVQNAVASVNVDEVQQKA